MTNCQSCGMPMNAPADFGAGKTDNLYCRYCTDATGNLLPKEVVRQNMIQFYTQTVGKTPEEATVEVDKIMGTMMAWKIQPSEPVAPSEPAQPVTPVAPASPQGEPIISEPLVSEVAPVPPALPLGGPVITPAKPEDKPQ